MSDLPEYRYPELPAANKAIRLLEIQRGNSADRSVIRYLLKGFAVSHAPSYDAISYAWGAKLPYEVIYIDGKRLLVRESCGRILRQLSYFLPSQYIWIDAICINQEDVEERNSQVAMMGDIYRHARRVLACNPAVDADTVFATSILHENTWGVTPTQRPENIPIDSPQASLSVDERIQFYRGLIKLTQLPYFQRVWIVQELSLAREVYFCYGLSVVSGSQLCLHLNRIKYGYLAKQTYDQDNELIEARRKWDPLRDMISDEHEEAYGRSHRPQSPRPPDISSELNAALCEPGLQLYEDASDLLYISSKKETRVGAQHTIWDAIRLSKTKQCEDPRDRVFGLLALIDWQGNPPVRPDYRSSAFKVAVTLCSYDLGGPVGRQLTQNLRLAPESVDVVDGIAKRQKGAQTSGEAHPNPSNVKTVKNNVMKLADLIQTGKHRQTYVGERMRATKLGAGEPWSIPEEDQLKPYRRVMRQSPGNDPSSICVAIVSSRFQWGDWIAQQTIETGNSYPTADSLILRSVPRGEFFFTIEGRAIVATTGAGWGNFINVDIAFHPEDFFLYAAASTRLGSLRPPQLDADQLLPNEAAQMNFDTPICEEPGSSLAVRTVEGEGHSMRLFDPHYSGAEVRTDKAIAAKMREISSMIKPGGKT